MVKKEITEKLKRTLKYAAKKLKKEKKRAYMAEVTNEYFDGSPYKAERYLGWCRKAILLGQHELRRGIICIGNYSARGRPKTEEVLKNLTKDIEAIVEEESQTDPKFQTKKRFCKISAKSVCKMLREKNGYTEKELRERTMNDILNRMGYSLKKRKKLSH